MARWTFLSILFIALSSSLLLLPWVSIGQQTLTGAEISDLSNLLPALAILILLISLYGRLSQVLRLLAALVLGIGALLAISTDFTSVAASVALQESITGVAGENSLAASMPTPYIFGVTQLIASLISLALMRLPTKNKHHSASTATDSRGLWESQS